MNRIDKTLEGMKTSSKKILSPYITAGDPTPKHTVNLMHALVEAGADILEIGIPFSDPMAEGPVIQAAMERALNHNLHIAQILEMIACFRNKDKLTPIVLMGYVNPIEYYGYEPFAKDAVNAGVDGTILVDLPPEESETISSIWDSKGLYSIYLCSPTTSDKRMTLINKFAKGYLYYVSLKGVTGSDAFDLNSVKIQYEKRKQQIDLPLMVGFGIKTPQIAAQIAEFADGVIIGAALISTILEAYKAGLDCCEAGASLLSSLRLAMDNI